MAIAVTAQLALGIEVLDQCLGVFAADPEQVAGLGEADRAGPVCLVQHCCAQPPVLSRGIDDVSPYPHRFASGDELD